MAAYGWRWIKAWADGAAESLLDLLYPPRCPFCGKILDQPSRTVNPPLRNIAPSLRTVGAETLAPSQSAAPFRIVRAGNGNQPRDRVIVCGTCAASLPWRTEPLRKFPEGFVCAGPLSYENAVRTALLQLKFRGELSHVEAFGALAAQCAADCFSGEFDTVTWVPISRERRRKRGYDQSEELARAACRVWMVRPARLLVKTADNPPQSGLHSAEERIRNAAGVYAPARGASIQGRRVLLIDDICTTGATLLECRRTLLENGAAAVFGVVAAITERK